MPGLYCVTAAEQGTVSLAPQKRLSSQRKRRDFRGHAFYLFHCLTNALTNCRGSISLRKKLWYNYYITTFLEKEAVC